MKYRTEVSGTPLDVEILQHEGSVWTVNVEGRSLVLDVVQDHVIWDARSLPCRVVEDDHGLPTRVALADHEYEVLIRREGRGNVRGPASRGFTRATETHGRVAAPMNGQVVKVLREVDEALAKGDVVLVLEAMKMENEVVSPVPGILESLCVKTGDTVKPGDALFVVRPAED